MGHYTASCLDENGWCFYNDSRWDLSCTNNSNNPNYALSPSKMSVSPESSYSLILTLDLHNHSVISVSENQLQTNQAYVLFYHRSAATSTARK